MKKNCEPKVAAIILNWNKYELTARCIESILELDYNNVAIIVVDNASTDDSLIRLKSKFKECFYLINDENLGFSAGINVGIREALKVKAEYVLIINNDLHLNKRSLNEVVACFQSSDAIAAVTGKILFDDNTNRIWQAGGYIDMFRASGVPRGLDEIDSGQYEIAENVEWASGALSIFSAKCLLSVGLFPEEYFFGQEEWDYSAAIKNHKLVVKYLPSFIGYHRAGGSYKSNHPVLNTYGGYINKFIFAKKYLSWYYYPVWKVIFIIYLVCYSPILAVKNSQNLRESITFLKATALAVYDSFFIKKITREHLFDVATRLNIKPGW
ncbi:glycosyltransferase family 2 protein [Shewanella sp.]|uniref:glycosyltransferase family 2 protein n=1 Tax=Shewanella sp. TaxID=50422 RepID=UPI004047424A